MSNKYYWLNEDSRKFLSRDYLLPGTTPEQRVRDIADYSESILGIDGFADKFEDYMSRGWFSLSTPVWCNFGLDRGFGISCFSVDVMDSLDDIFRANAEVGMLSKVGGGTAAYFGNLRPRGSNIKNNGKSSGAVSAMEVFQSTINYSSQGSTRRGSFAAYLPIDHDDYYEFMDCRSEGSKVQDISLGVTISDDFMNRLESRDKDAEERIVKLYQKRFETGYPYIFFDENINKGKPRVYKDKGLNIKQSNLCAEVAEYTDDKKSFTCCLSSMNLLHYDEWKDTDAVKVLTYFLDSVLTDFIRRAEGVPFLEKVVLFAKEHRSIGLGVLGYHSYLQSKMIAFESITARSLNKMIFRNIDSKSLEASKELAAKYGEPDMLKGYGERFTTRCVTGDTLILTDKGNVRIKELVGKSTKIWNGFEFSVVEPYETGIDDIYEVVLSNGKRLKCTDGHIFKVATMLTDTKSFSRHKVIDVPLKNLRVGDVMEKFLLPIIDTELELKDAYTQGFFSGDGSISNSKGTKYPRKEIRLYGDKMICADRIVWKSCRKANYGGRDLVRGYIDNNYEDKFFIPIGYSIKSKLDWLAGLIDSDGYSCSKGISITMKECEFAKGVSMLLTELGCHTKVSKINRVGGFSSEHSFYYSVNISMESLYTLKECGLKLERVKLNAAKSRRPIPNHNWIYIVEINKLGNKEMTYCFTEKHRNTGVFNGIMTGQCAIAPTTSSSFILGQISPSIEPLNSNYFLKDLAKGKFSHRNPFLKDLLESKGKNTEKVWKSILTHGGSVQHLDFLDEEEKFVFKTFGEISQLEIVTQAADRQEFIDQSQSLNLMIHPKTPLHEVHSLFMESYKLGVKTLYYQRSANLAQEVGRDLMNCVMCE